MKKKQETWVRASLVGPDHTNNRQKKMDLKKK